MCEGARGNHAQDPACWVHVRTERWFSPGVRACSGRPRSLADRSCSHARQGVLGQHTNLPALLALFFRDDLTSWASKRVAAGRPSAAAGAAGLLSLPQLKALVAANTNGCIDRLRQVRSRAVSRSPTSAEHTLHVCPFPTQSCADQGEGVASCFLLHSDAQAFTQRNVSAQGCHCMPSPSALWTERCHEQQTGDTTSTPQVAPQPGIEGVEAGIAMQRGVHDLVEAATDTNNLCRMDATWQAWF